MIDLVCRDDRHEPIEIGRHGLVERGIILHGQEPWFESEPERKATRVPL